MVASGSEAVVRRLRRDLLDSQIGSAPPGMLDCAAHMLLYFDDLDALQRIGLQHLLSRFSATRVDIGYARPKSLLYRADASQVRPGCSVPDVRGHDLPNLDEGIQVVWRNNGPVLLDIDTAPALDRLRPLMRTLGTRTKLARRLEYRLQCFGIVRIDQTEERRHWGEVDQRYLDLFVLAFLGPIAAERRAFGEGAPSIRLTAVELAVLRLAAEGRSYKEIAAALSKSPNTVDNQLRRIRAKLSVRNQVELASACIRLSQTFEWEPDPGSDGGPRDGSPPGTEAGSP